MLLSAALFVIVSPLPAQSTPPTGLVRDRYGAIFRADTSQKKIALVFTGDEHGESTAPILDSLRQRKIKAGFFVTGNFLRQADLRALLKQAIDEGHYVGPHSSAHLLYCDWEDREETLVTRQQFREDLKTNVVGLQAVGAVHGGMLRLFIPPYEWYNADQVQWSKELGLTLINFTPGSGSNRDYAPEGDRRFVPARTIYRDILAYEQKDPHGLNGFILLLHLGSGREDPFHPLLGRLCDELTARGYEFARIDALCAGADGE